jgi:hypothetical protein
MGNNPHPRSSTMRFDACLIVDSCSGSADSGAITNVLDESQSRPPKIKVCMQRCTSEECYYWQYTMRRKSCSQLAPLPLHRLELWLTLPATPIIVSICPPNYISQSTSDHLQGADQIASLVRDTSDAKSSSSDGIDSTFLHVDTPEETASDESEWQGTG